MVKVGSWHIGPNDSKLHGISDQEALERASLSLELTKKNSMVLAAVTVKGTKIWTAEEELKEMKGHVRGLLRSNHGRNFLDARKINLAFDRGIGRR